MLDLYLRQKFFFNVMRLIRQLISRGLTLLLFNTLIRNFY